MTHHKKNLCVTTGSPFLYQKTIQLVKTIRLSTYIDILTIFCWFNGVKSPEITFFDIQLVQKCSIWVFWHIVLKDVYLFEEIRKTVKMMVY